MGRVGGQRRNRGRSDNLDLWTVPASFCTSQSRSLDCDGGGGRFHGEADLRPVPRRANAANGANVAARDGRVEEPEKVLTVELQWTVRPSVGF